MSRQVQYFVVPFLAVTLAFPVLQDSLQGDILPVVLSGQPAPGIAGARFTGIAAASLNTSGDMVFRASLEVHGVEGVGIYRISGGVLSPVALSGQPLPDGSGRSFGGNLDWPGINSSGDIVFTSNFASGEEVMSGIFLYSADSLRKLIDTSATGPGTSGRPFTGFVSPRINDNGDVAFVASAGSTSPSSGIFLMSKAGGLTLVQNSYFGNTLALNNHNDIVFPTTNGISAFSGGVVRSIVSDGQAVPNSNLTVLTAGLAQPALNDDGDVVFVNCVLEAAGRGNIPTPFANAVIRWRQGVLQKIAAAGDPVPGMDGATFWLSGFNGPQINQAGIVFGSATNPRPGQGVMRLISRYRSGQLSVVARGDEVVQGIGQLSDFGAPAFDSQQGPLVTFVGQSNPFTDSPAAPEGIYAATAGAIYTSSFPQVADGTASGSGWRTTFMLANQSTTLTSATLTFYDDAGAPMSVAVGGHQQSQVTIAVPARGVAQIQTEGTGPLKTGWARVQSDQMVSGIALYGFADTSGNFLGEVGVLPAPPLRALSLFAQSGNVSTGIAIANPNAAAASVTLILKDSGGNELSRSSVTIPALGHLAKYTAELFDKIPAGEFEGKVDVVSTLPLVCVALRQRGAVFTALPIIP